MEQENYYWGYEERNIEMQRLREPLDAVYKTLGASTIEAITNDKENYTGIDYRLRMSSGKTFGVEEKIQFEMFKFPLEQLIELDHWKKRNKEFHSLGWSQKTSASNLLVSFCSASGDFFIYDYQKVLKFIKENLLKGLTTNLASDKEILNHIQTNNNNIRCYIPSHAPASSYYTTRNLIIDRNIFSDFLMFAGNVSFNLKYLKNKEAKKYIVRMDYLKS